MQILDPVGHVARTPLPLSPRLDTLRGRTVCLLDISKPKGNHFLDELERLLVAEQGARVLRRRKPTFSRPAPEELAAGIAAEADCVVEALAD